MPPPALSCGSSLRESNSREPRLQSRAVRSSAVCIKPFTMYALNAATGATIWTQSVGAAIEDSAVVVNGNIYVGGTDGKIYAFNASTGAPLWTPYATSGEMVIPYPLWSMGLWHPA